MMVEKANMNRMAVRKSAPQLPTWLTIAVCVSSTPLKVS